MLEFSESLAHRDRNRGFGAASSGWAHGPSRQKVTESIVIDAPPRRLGNDRGFSRYELASRHRQDDGRGGNEQDTARVS